MIKRTYLLALSLLIVFSAFSQGNPFKMDKKKMRVEQAPSKINTSDNKREIAPLPKIPTPDRDVDIVNVIDIGTSANAFTYWQKLSYLWVSPELNTVTNIHRMGGALDPGGYSGDLGYDISKDGGQNWDNMVEMYVAQGNPDEWSFASARHPQGGIFSRAGNIDPDDAFITYFSPCLYDTPPPWSYLHGISEIGDTTINKYSYLFSNDRFYQNIPLGYDITSEGKVFVVDENTDKTGDELIYRDSLIITKGLWDDGIQDFIYTRQSLEATMANDAGAPIDYKIAFGSDGQTGYIVAIGDNGIAEQVEGFQNYYPIYWKTEDGGETWSYPDYIQLDGPNGLNDILYHHLTDEQIAELFGNNPPPRDEISYTTAYDCDIAVDQWNNLHIAVVIGPTGIDPYSIVTAQGFLGAIDIFSRDGGESWENEEMGRPRTFRGTFGDIDEDNRIQITTNPDADKIFISWLDTDLEDENENNRPNIWVRGFDPITGELTIYWSGECRPTNVTLFSEGMWQAYLFAAPKYCFESNGNYNIPYTYVEMDPLDPYQAVQFKYIQDFSFNDWDFVNCHVGVDNYTTTHSIEVLGNSPNPFRKETAIQIELSYAVNVGVKVHSITGQYLFEADFGRLEQGTYKLPLKFQGYSSGVYFYTVTAGQHSVTKKMVVK